MGGQDNRIILYHYSYSPYARRIVWYLILRGLDYAQVMQPPYMPRPDLEAIDVSYRRIPILSIGKDVYCDTRIILSKLEKLFPEGKLGSDLADQQGLERLLESWTVESGIFVRASQLIPSDTPIMKDPKFAKDREQFSGRPWSKEAVDRNRPEALAHIRNAFDVLENTFLSDDREWILRTNKPSLADIQAIWPFHWLTTLKGALPSDVISDNTHPKAFAWIDRFNRAIKSARDRLPKPETLKGEAASKCITGAPFVDENEIVDGKDPSGLQKGDLVEVYPIDSGFSHRDKGKLAALTVDEVVIELANGIRLHTPRTGFRIARAKVRAAAKM